MYERESAQRVLFWKFTRFSSLCLFHFLSGSICSAQTDASPVKNRLGVYSSWSGAKRGDAVIDQSDSNDRLHHVRREGNTDVSGERSLGVSVRIISIFYSTDSAVLRLWKTGQMQTTCQHERF